jgi:hypothetical protein
LIQEYDLDKQTAGILATITTKAVAARGWKFEIERQPRNRWTGDTASLRFGDKLGRDGKSHTYTALVKATCVLSAPRATVDSEFQALVAHMALTGKKPNWKVAAVEGEAWTPVERPKTWDGLPPMAGQDGAELIGYSPFHIPADFESYFTDPTKGGGLIGLEHHVSRVKDALLAAERSGWQHRLHVMLAGPPGCGKTHLCQALKRALGESSVLEFDGTSTTKAGAEKELLERVEMPRILLVEEIEKIASPETLDYMLGLLDLRGEIRKTTAKSSVQRDIKMLAVCTVNDVRLFKSLRSGALFSRFATHCYFKRPTHDMLSGILRREIAKVQGGSEAWIEPAIAFADEQGITDPRGVIATCMAGAERLLTGEYQASVRATSAEAAGVEV